MGFVKEFKEFAVKGNVIDLAVGVIIGGAFGKIIDSIINDLVMPIIASVIGAPDFSNAYIPLKRYSCWSPDRTGESHGTSVRLWKFHNSCH